MTKKSLFFSRIRNGMLFLLSLLILQHSYSAALAEYGDVNSDGKEDIQDAFLLRDYLVSNPAGINESNADMNGDDTVDLKDIILLERELGKMGVESSETDPDHSELKVSDVVYGQSERGRDLVCTVIEPSQYSRTVLAIFAIHGFEDWYDHDGQELVDTAELAIEYFKNAGALTDCRMMIVAPANPDGLIDGTTNNGFGRCNAKGIDLNRDFDAAHVAMTSARNYTPYPFSGAESRALRDLCNAYNPDIVLDCHGWEDCTIGDSELAQVFQEEMGLAHRVTFSDNAHGYFSYWAHNQGALSLLVEFKNPDFDRQTFINALARLAAGDYEDGTGIYEVDPAFDQFDIVNSYTLSTDRVTTYLDIEGDEAGYISGASDLCAIQKIYKNGWVRVSYPIASGYKTAYCPLSDFIDSGNRIELTPLSVSQNQTVYRRSSLDEKLGTIYPTDIAYSVAVSGQAVQILYPLDAGGWKLGWISHSDISGTARTLYSSRINTESMTGKIGLSDAVASPGDIIEVPIQLEGDDIIAVRIWLVYDAQVLKLLSVENGDLLQGLTLNADTSNGLYCMLWSDSLIEDMRPVDGTLARLRFQVEAESPFQNVGITALIQTGDGLSSALADVRVASSETQISVIDLPRNILRLPDDIEVIEAEAFAGSYFDTVYLTGKHLRAVESRAFADCQNLHRVIVRTNNMDIAPDAFEGCDNYGIIFEESK